MKNSVVFIDCGGSYKVGDPCPDGYIQRQEWAEVHMKAGLKQKECCMCGRWQFPHELSERIIKTPCTAETRIGRKKQFENIVLESRICKKCESEQAA